MGMELQDVLMYIASIALIVFASAIVVAIYLVVRLMRRIEELIGSIRGEVETLRHKRMNLEVSGRTAWKVMKIVTLFLFRRRLF